MESSDSEAFESADEDFEPDNKTEVQEVSNKTCDNNKNIQETLESIENELKCDLDCVTLENTFLEHHNVVKKSDPTLNESEENELDCDTLENTEVIKKSDTITAESSDSATSTVSDKVIVDNLTSSSAELLDYESEQSKRSSLDYDVSQSKLDVQQNFGWDTEWTPIDDDDENEDEKVATTNKIEKSNDSGWDDFDTWDTIEDDVSKNDEKDVSSVLEKLSVNSDKSWSNWSNWGVTNLLSTATEGVTTLTSGLTTVIESSIGAPSPEELVRVQQIEQNTNQSVKDESVSFGFSNLFTGVTKLVETTGSKVVNTGLDTLEVIGKKTMQVLQDGDPGLVKKRKLLGLNPEKPCLSQVLREAKEKAESDDRKTPTQKRKIHFETLFDDYQGLVHLEALEMLSKQCDIKLDTISESLADKELADLQETMLQVKELCELADEDDDEHLSLNELKIKLDTAVSDLDIEITFKKLFNIWEQNETVLTTIDNDLEQIHEMAIDTLAQLTSAAVEQFHKCAELLLIKERRSTADEADSLVQLTTALTSLIGIVAGKYSEKLDTLGSVSDNTDLNDLITNIFFEATQSSSYIQDAFQLFIPILQIGTV